MKNILAIFLTFITACVVFLVMTNFNVDFTTRKTKATQHQTVSQPKTQETATKEDGQAQEKTADGKPVGKWVYLTFDDGPSQYTGQFLDILKKENIKATFFMQGVNLKKTELQENVKRAIKEGHYIGAHSMTHDANKLYKQEQFLPEMKECISIIHDITGKSPTLIRAPYGSAPELKKKEKIDQIVNAGLKMWDWTIDSEDWKLKETDSPSIILDNIQKGTTDDVEVVLMHEKPKTLEELPAIIQFYKEKGYSFGVYNESNHFHVTFTKDPRL
ncbi:polysaccharide deacetylase family protein [Bacillus thuringiensis]|uniref:polysaccharide deacetylase family protein n=1 Tax=Bacillus thuringiensis TaxID=1428 RepID=UPI000CF8C91D|nr:peptidoglycan-N-acetylglucosamine deacetylase [Bacillus thuringiensis]